MSSTVRTCVPNVAFSAERARRERARARERGGTLKTVKLSGKRRLWSVFKIVLLAACTHAFVKTAFRCEARQNTIMRTRLLLLSLASGAPLSRGLLAARRGTDRAHGSLAGVTASPRTKRLQGAGNARKWVQSTCAGSFWSLSLSSPHPPPTPVPCIICREGWSRVPSRSRAQSTQLSTPPRNLNLSLQHTHATPSRGETRWAC